MRSQVFTDPGGRGREELLEGNDSKDRYKAGGELYPHRIAIVEQLFGNIRTNKRLDRFTLRGKVKVNIQWLLYCMVHNIEKIVNFGYATVCSI
jgi:hypothetical protein